MASAGRVTMRQAAAILGVSHTKIWQLVRDRVLAAEQNPLDRRERLIPLADVERLKEGTTDDERPWPRTIGAADLGIQSDEVDEWLDATWRPC